MVKSKKELIQEAREAQVIKLKIPLSDIYVDSERKRWYPFSLVLDKIRADDVMLYQRVYGNYTRKHFNTATIFGIPFVNVDNPNGNLNRTPIHFKVVQ